MKKKSLVFGGIAVVIILLVFYTKTSGQQVETINVEQGSLRTWVEETAYVQARDELLIQSSQSGKIAKVAVEIGQKVAAGQTLLLLENLDLQYQQDELAVQSEQLQGQLLSAQATLEQARLDLQESQKDLQRLEKLFQAGAIANAEYEDAVQNHLQQKKTVEQQELGVLSLQKQIAKQNTLYNDVSHRNQQLLVKSPVAGTILDLPAKVEQTVPAGTALAQIGTAGALELKTELLSDDLAAIKIGQKAEISAPILGDRVLYGKVMEIYPRAYEKTSALGVIQRRVPVIISLPDNPLLKPGYEVQVKIETQHKSKVITLPRIAVRVNAQGQNEVLAVNAGRIRHITVQTGLKNSELVEIKSGLKAGQTIVRDASTDMKENTRVKT